MKSGSKLFIFAGVGLGLVAVLLIIASMGGGGGGTGAQSNDKGKVTVVQAVVDIPAHNILLPEDLVTKEVPSSQAPADAVRSISEVVGKSYRVPLASTQTLVSSQVEQPGLRNDIAVGKRAVSVPVDEKNIFAGLIQDGDFIDVIFHARVNVVRLLPTNMAISPEDEPWYSFTKNKGGSKEGEPEEETTEEEDGLGGTTTGGVVWVPPGLESDFPNHPATGDAGSQLFIHDDIGEAQELEPVAKVMVQDARVLRVVRPGESYGPDGTISEESEEVAGAANGPEPTTGYIIVEVNLEQAEVLTFMQDEKHDFQVVVRGKDDHEYVDTNGVTFEMLYQSGNYDLPLPGSITVSSKKK